MKRTLALCVLLLSLCCASIVGAQEKTPAPDSPPAIDPHPLRPPDTSSPRETLRSFLNNVDIAAEAWRRGTQDSTTDRAWRSALMALDFSATPDNDS